MHKLFIIIFSVLMLPQVAASQEGGTELLSHQDTLRGSVGPERAWWDVLKYDILVAPSFKTKSITGSNTISFKAIAQGQVMQIDLQQPMQITKASFRQKTVRSRREGNVYFIDLGEALTPGTIDKISIDFAGVPKEALKPPWDGGWIWQTDATGAPWMTVACQGLGASVWYPCKDYQGDEPDSASLSMTVPDTLVGVGNGRLRATEKNTNGTTTYRWAVVNPINNYCIIPYIGRYVHWSDTVAGIKGPLSCDYWALKEDEVKARHQFTQVASMMRCFEHWFGPYPFYEDGYKLVEAPHLGMEHQSAIAYGNHFLNGYLGRDLSGTGLGLKWDFIIIHESAHEWFGNNITTRDLADMWVHEAFASYAEVLYGECQLGKNASSEFAIGTRRGIINDSPVIAPYGVNREGSTDMYTKGSAMLHMIRQIIDNDDRFRQLLLDLNKTFYHQTVTSAQVEAFISSHAGFDCSRIFDQYLRTTNVPVLEYRYEDGALVYRWRNCVAGFNMPVKIIADKPLWLKPSERWQSMPLPSAAFRVDPNFYVNSRKL